MQAGASATVPVACLKLTVQELAFVRSQDPRTIWTFVDGDDGNQYVLSGYHFVNRIGYLISTIPFPEDADIIVFIPTDPDA